MAKPTNEMARVLRGMNISNRDKVHIYLLHIATKKEDGRWFAMVKTRTIGEQLDIDSNREVENIIRDIGAEPAQTLFMKRVNPGFYLPTVGQPPKPDIAETMVQMSGTMQRIEQTLKEQAMEKKRRGYSIGRISAELDVPLEQVEELLN